MSSERDQLGDEQASLLLGLLGQQEAPPGFDADQFRVQRELLVSKRRRLVARQRPALVEQLGQQRFQELFDAYAITHPRCVGQSVGRDARAWTKWLFRHGALHRRWWARRSDTLDHGEF